MAILEDIKKDTKQMAAFLAFGKRKAILESILFYFDKGNEEALYKKYVSSKSPTQCNFSDKVQNGLDLFAKTSEWGKMKPLLTQGKAEIQQMLQQGALKKGGDASFYSSKEYQVWHTANGPKVVDPKKALESAQKALKILGFDPKLPELAEYLALKQQGKDGEAAKELDKAQIEIIKNLKAKAAKNATKAATLLGIKDKVNLGHALGWMACSKYDAKAKGEAIKILDKILIIEKSKDKAAAIYASLEKSGLV